MEKVNKYVTFSSFCIYYVRKKNNIIGGFFITMCGIVGFVNLKQELEQEKYKNVLSNMMTKIARRGPDEEDIFCNKHAMLGHKRLIVVDPEGRQATYDMPI